jgi:PII-like signaling protein
MIEREVLMIRVYLSEHEGRLPKVLALLHDDLKVRGLTVFRAMSGYGSSGRWHTSSLVDLSLDLPIVVEFFDEPTLARAALERLDTLCKPGHVVEWPARMLTA